MNQHLSNQITLKFDKHQIDLAWFLTSASITSRLNWSPIVAIFASTCCRPWQDWVAVGRADKARIFISYHIFVQTKGTSCEKKNGKRILTKNKIWIQDNNLLITCILPSTLSSRSDQTMFTSVQLMFHCHFNQLIINWVLSGHVNDVVCGFQAFIRWCTDHYWPAHHLMKVWRLEHCQHVLKVLIINWFE